jgi:hypothetical protein
LTGTASTYRLLPLLGKGHAAVDIGRVEFRLRRQARIVEALFPRNLGELLLDLSIAIVIEEVQERLLKLERVKTLASPRLKVVGDKLVKVFTPNKSVQIPDEVETLLIGNGAEGILRVYTLVADDQLGELMVLSEQLNSALYEICISKL